FVGAGFSLNAQPRLPSWGELFPQEENAEKQELVSDLEKKLAYQLEGMRFPDRAQVWADRDGSTAVHQAVLSKIDEGKPKPSLLHFQLLSLPWQVIITTNYDTLIEDTLLAQG